MEPQPSMTGAHSSRPLTRTQLTLLAVGLWLLEVLLVAGFWLNVKGL